MLAFLGAVIVVAAAYFYFKTRISFAAFCLIAIFGLLISFAGLFWSPFSRDGMQSTGAAECEQQGGDWVANNCLNLNRN